MHSASCLDEETPIIAVVDDDEAIRSALESYLRSYGYESRLFRSAEDYLAYPSRSEVSCVVSDIRMAGMSGLEMQRRLMSLPEKRPLIFMTSYDDGATRDLAMKQGASAFLGKPLGLKELAEQIKNAIHR